tara:strand:+ start:3998 stop:5362 length:1365 start_codon:yes stop_codon:yes gene_type:complete
MSEYIYLLQKREFIKTKENIYKIGKTKQENLKRIGNYDKGSILICQFKCNDCDKLEKKLIRLFRERYELQKDIGNEYFKGNCNDMRDDIYYVIKNENIIENREEFHNETDEYNIYKKLNNEEYYLVDTFEKYKIVSDSIKKVIITDKKNQIGYILLNNGPIWHNIYKYSPYLEVEEQECLLGWLKTYSEKTILQNRNCIYTNYDYDKIIQDLIKNQSSSTQKKWVLSYGSYFIGLCDHERNYVLNTETFEMVEYNPETDDILTYDDSTSSPLYNIKDIQEANTDFVDTAIRFIIDDEKSFKKYCQLTYNIFVKQEEKEVVFVDNTGSFLTTWIINALDIISPNGDLCIDISKDHKIPKKYNPETRLVIINNVYYVPKLLVKGYKNIIIMKKTWNENKFINFIKEKKESILSESHYKENDSQGEWWFQNLNGLSIEIFDNRRLLLNNYLKWCCNK